MSNKSNILIVALLIAGMAISCSNEPTDSFIIRVNDAEHQQLNLSDYVISLEYVPLETTDACLIDKYPSFYVLDEYIVALTWRQCFLFNRKGKFIREIGRAGNGPNEYLRTLPGETVNEKEQTVSMVGQGKGIMYSFFNGEVAGNFPIAPNMQETAYVSDNLWIQGINNVNGNAINQMVFTDQLQVIDSIPNHQLFQIENTPMRFSIPEHYFYTYNDEPYYKNLFNDTIFQIKDKKLHPIRIFDMGIYHLSYTIKANPEKAFTEHKKHNQVEKILETDQFILFSIKREDEDNAFIFNKHTGQTVVLSKEQNLKGFYNDIDGGIPFWPIRINRNQEMVSFLNPYNMQEMLTDEYFGHKKINNMAAHLKLKELLTNIKEEDNPVVVIAKLKTP